MASTAWCNVCKEVKAVDKQVNGDEVAKRCRTCGDITIVSRAESRKRCEKEAEGRRRYNMTSPPMRNRVD